MSTGNGGASFGGSFGGGYNVNVTPSQPKQETTKQATLIFDVATQSFVKDVIEASKKQPVLVDFWAPWCGPCKTLTPIIEKAVNMAKGKVLLAKMNIDDHTEVAGQLGIQSIPAVIAFVNGQPVDGFMGAQSEKQVNDFITKVTKDIKSETDEMLTAADETAKLGDFEGAIQIYAAIFQQEPENAKAIAGFLGCSIELGQVDEAEGFFNELPPELQNNSLLSAIKTRLELINSAKNVSPTAELEEAIAKDPNNHQARIDLSIALNANGKRMEAADQLLESFKRDKIWNEEAARKQLVQFFESWGAMDDASRYARRQLSSMMFK